MFSCEFCEISKNIFSYRTPLVAASRRTLTDPPGDERLQNKRLRIVKEEDAQQWSLPKKLYSNENFRGVHNRKRHKNKFYSRHDALSVWMSLKFLNSHLRQRFSKKIHCSSRWTRDTKRYKIEWETLRAH